MPDVICCAVEACCGKKPDETDEEYFNRKVDFVTNWLAKDDASEDERHVVRAAVRKLLKHVVLAPLEFGPAIQVVAKMAREHGEYNG